MDMKNVLSDIKNLALSVIPTGGGAWLYGSRARGTAHRHSDWDVLLILRKDTLTQADYDTVSYPFVLFGCELGEEINPILYTEKEWQSYQATPFFENVQHDAINLLSCIRRRRDDRKRITIAHTMSQKKKQKVWRNRHIVLWRRLLSLL